MSFYEKKLILCVQAISYSKIENVDILYQIAINIHVKKHYNCNSLRKTTFTTRSILKTLSLKTKTLQTNTPSKKKNSVQKISKEHISPCLHFASLLSLGIFRFRGIFVVTSFVEPMLGSDRFPWVCPKRTKTTGMSMEVIVTN